MQPLALAICGGRRLCLRLCGVPPLFLLLLLLLQPSALSGWKTSLVPRCRASVHEGLLLFGHPLATVLRTLDWTESLYHSVRF